MMAASAKPRPVAGFAIFTTVMLVAFVGLGIWQLQRRVEKHALIAALDQRLAEAPGTLPPPSQWGALTAAHDEFRRVQFQATYDAAPDVMVYSSGSAIRSDISSPGAWAFLPARLSSGEIVVVNAGFVPSAMPDRAQQDRAVKPLLTNAPVMLTGYLRFPEHAGLLTPQKSLAKRLWFTRDHLAMADALGWAGNGGLVAPFYIDLEQPVPANGVPKPGALEVHLKDDHMQYAITWFSLAGAVVIAFAVWWRAQRR